MNLTGLLIFFCHIAVLAALEKKGVHTSLKANWDSTSLLAEARLVIKSLRKNTKRFFSEFIAEENEKLFVKFIDIVNKDVGTLNWEKCE